MHRPQTLEDVNLALREVSMDIFGQEPEDAKANQDPEVRRDVSLVEAFLQKILEEGATLITSFDDPGEREAHSYDIYEAATCRDSVAERHFQ